MNLRRGKWHNRPSGMSIMLLILVPGLAVMFSPRHSSGQADCRRFESTEKSVCGRFLNYWEVNGGLDQQGLPISDTLQEQSDTDGKVYAMQYFERSVFEYHPENQPPYDILLSLLGRLEYHKAWPGPYYPVQEANADNPLFFKETGKTLSGAFRVYWEASGGLAQQGYPISNEFVERSPLDDKPYKVQYFERAVFELHPENRPPHNVLLSHLGRFHYDAKRVVPRPTPTAKTSFEDCMDARRRKGTIIAQGTNNVPTRAFGLKTYQIEEIRFPGPVTCVGLSPNTTFERLWRVVLFADGPFYEGSMGLHMWVDGVRLGAANGGVDRYTTLLTDITPLLQGEYLGLGFSYEPMVHLPEEHRFNRSP